MVGSKVESKVEMACQVGRRGGEWVHDRVWKCMIHDSAHGSSEGYCGDEVRGQVDLAESVSVYLH